jgi:hypothetical protein
VKKQYMAAIKKGQRRLFSTRPHGGYISGEVTAVHGASVTMRIGGNGPLSGLWHISKSLVGPKLVSWKEKGKGKCAMCNRELGRSWRCGNCGFVN